MRLIRWDADSSVALPNRISSNDRGTSKVSVDTHRPAKGIEDTGDEDAPLAMTEGGIKTRKAGICFCESSELTKDQSSPLPDSPAVLVPKSMEQRLNARGQT